LLFASGVGGRHINAVAIAQADVPATGIRQTAGKNQPGNAHQMFTRILGQEVFLTLKRTGCLSSAAAGVLSSVPGRSFHAAAAHSHKLPAQNRDRLPTQDYSLPLQADTHHAAARRGLPGDELIFPQPLFPEWPQATMGRACNGILIHS
jgi:hypothetical protein